MTGEPLDRGQYIIYHFLKKTDETGITKSGKEDSYNTPPRNRKTDSSNYRGIFGTENQMLMQTACSNVKPKKMELNCVCSICILVNFH